LRTARLHSRKIIMSSLGFEKTIKSTMVLAEEKLTQVLQEKGFGILSRIDFACKMKEKLNKTVPPTLILGACNPALAYEAYTQDKNMLLLVPCNVTLEQTSDSEVKVSMIRPSMMLKALEKENLITMAKQADDILEAVIQGL
jgi:uncharacterized protein (DUF302 family)